MVRALQVCLFLLLQLLFCAFFFPYFSVCLSDCSFVCSFVLFVCLVFFVLFSASALVSQFFVDSMAQLNYLFPIFICIYSQEQFVKSFHPAIAGGILETFISTWRPMRASRSSPVAATQVAGMASPLQKIATALVQVKHEALATFDLRLSLYLQFSSHSNQHIYI